MGFPFDGKGQIGAGNGTRNRIATVLMLVFTLVFFSTSATVAAPPQRVVSTNLCADEYVFRLVDHRHITALSFEAGDRHPVVSTIADHVGGIPLIHPSAETVLRYNPDLVVMFEGTLPKLHVYLATLGVPVLDIPYDTSLADVRRTTRMVAARLGAPRAADILISGMDATLAAARTARLSPPVRTLIYEPNGYATSGPVTRELMAAAGLEDAAPQYAVTRSGRIPVEAVIAAAPELLLFNGDRTAVETRADRVLHHPALAALDGRTATAWTSLTPLLCAGPWSADVALTFAELGRKARALAQAPHRP
jgi:iron complex transport system substrate-binding protein